MTVRPISQPVGAASGGRLVCRREHTQGHMSRLLTALQLRVHSINGLSKLAKTDWNLIISPKKPTTTHRFKPSDYLFLHIMSIRGRTNVRDTRLGYYCYIKDQAREKQISASVESEYLPISGRKPSD